APAACRSRRPRPGRTRARSGAGRRPVPPARARARARSDSAPPASERGLDGTRDPARIDREGRLDAEHTRIAEQAGEDRLVGTHARAAAAVLRAAQAVRAARVQLEVLAPLDAR